MAFSQSLPKGQIPVSCKLCMADTKISWKCQECDVLMCNRCKETIHPNIKNAKNHKVLDIKEAGLQSEDVSAIQCKHKGRDCVMYCKSCDQLVCPLCISKIHNSHELAEISEGYQIHIERLQKGQNQIKNHLDVLTKQGAKIEEIKKGEKSKYTEEKKKLQAHNKALRKAVDQYTDKLMKELDQKWKAFMDCIEKEERQVITLKQNKKEQNQQVEKILNSIVQEKVFEESKKLEIVLKEKLDLPDVKFNSVPDFLPGEISQYNVGSLQNISTDIFIKVLKEFTADISMVLFMSSCVDSLWISYNDVVQKVKPEENNLRVISSFDIKVYGIAITPSNDLLLASRGPVLKIISGSTGEMKDSVYSVDPLDPIAVHVTSDYKILVGARNPGTAFPAYCRRVVILMDKEGKHKKCYEYDRHNQRLYKFPRRITTTHNGNMCVVDQLSMDFSGRVVVSGMEGNIINIYTGLPDINTKDKPFKPVSITTTPSDNIIVTEMYTNVLHILNNVGQLMTHIKGGDVGILRPYSIAFTTLGKVYIGCTRGQGSADNAKLYEVNLKLRKF